MSVSRAQIVDRQLVSARLSDGHRLLAVGSLVALSASYLGVLHSAASVVGVEARFIALTGATLVAAIVAARAIAPRPAAIGAGIVLVLALTIYLVTAPGGVRNLLGIWAVPLDTIAMLSGVTILAIVGLDVWVLAVMPGPLFISWYLVLRERYVAGAAIGLGAVTFLAATGDLTGFAAVGGVIGATGVVGFGELHRRGARTSEGDVLAVLLAAMLILSLSVSVIPGGGAQPINLGSGSGGPASTEAALIGGEEMSVTGSPSLDPTVRFTIEADEAENWRVDSFDRYTGDGWVQTGPQSAFEQDPGPPDGEEGTIVVEPEDEAGQAFPAPWRPVAVDGVDEPVESPGEGLRNPDGIEPGERYVITSDRPEYDPSAIEGDASPPSAITERYTQLPDSTPDRVGDLTAELVADAENTHQKARIIEQYLIETNTYSLDVDAPDGDIADAQLFERDEGYCAFFATTMAVMLRTQDIPARVVTGYSPGERVDEDRWVVRGMNAHAWVEVYIPEVGWVDYDPTPSGPYDAARDTRLAEARDEGEENVDTDETGGPEWQPDANQSPENETDIDPPGDIDGFEELQEACEDPDAVATGELTRTQVLGLCTPEQLEEMEGIDPDAANTSLPPSMIEEHLQEQEQETPELEPEEEDEGMPVPDRDHVAVALALLIAGVAGAHRGGVTRRGRRLVATRWQGQAAEPAGAIDRAWDRLEAHLGTRYDERRRGETVRAYVDRLSRSYDVDDRVAEVAAAYERARYAPGGVSADSARDTVGTVDELVGRRLPGPSAVAE